MHIRIELVNNKQIKPFIQVKDFKIHRTFKNMIWPKKNHVKTRSDKILWRECNAICGFIKIPVNTTGTQSGDFLLFVFLTYGTLDDIRIVYPRALHVTRLLYDGQPQRQSYVFIQFYDHKTSTKIYHHAL